MSDSRNPEVLEVRRQFITLANKAGLNLNPAASLYQAISRPWVADNAEIYLSSIGHIYMKISSLDRGFWGIGKRYYDGLKSLRGGQATIPYRILLLRSRLRDDVVRGSKFVVDGYLLEDLERPPLLKAPLLAKDDQFKIREGDLDKSALTFGAQDIIAGLLALSKDWMN